MGLIKEALKALGFTLVLVVIGWLVIFGVPEARAEEQTAKRVTAGISSLTQGSDWINTIQYEEEKKRAAETRARRAKAPGGVPQKIWGYCLEFETEHISAYILAGVAKVESDFNPRCITGKCFGLMQIHQTWEFDRFKRSESWDDPRASVRVCAEILEEHWQRYHSVRKALQVYNMGWSGANYDKTSYSDKVIRYAEKYKEEHK